MTDFSSQTPETPASGPQSLSDNRADTGAFDTGAPAAEPAAWADGLSEDNRTLVESKRWHGESQVELNKALDAYRTLQGDLGRSIPLPGDDATPSERDAFERRLGRPDTPDGYEFDLPDGLPESFPYSEDLAGRFRDWAFRAGVPAKAAQSLHNDYVHELAGLQQAETERLSTAEDQSHRDLVSDWGEVDSEAYQRNVLLADRALNRLGLTEVMRDFGVIGAEGGVRDARMVKALARVGSELYAEDNLHGSAGGGDNPFAGDNPNLTEQSRLIREARADPARAAHVRSLMHAAGIDPAAQRI